MIWRKYDTTKFKVDTTFFWDPEREERELVSLYALSADFLLGKKGLI